MTDLDEPLIDLVDLPVELVSWPAGGDRRDALARAAVPRLLLVAADAAPPNVVGVDEDWIRLPAAEKRRVGASDATVAIRRTSPQ